jgi:predicted RND superfamily exporter protein
LSTPTITSEKRYGGLQFWLDRKFEKLSHWAVDHTGWVFLALIILTLAGLFLASKVTQDNSLDAYFDPTDPAFVNYKAFQKEFNSDEVIYLVYRGRDSKDGVFNLETMRQVESLTRAIEAEVPFVRKATSLANVETIEAQGDDLAIRRLSDNAGYGERELRDLRNFTMSRPLYVGTLVSKDAQYGAILAEMTLASTDPIGKLRFDPNGGDGLANLYPQAPNNKLKEILARPQYRGLETMITGDVPWNSTYNEIIDHDLGVVTLATLGLAALLCMLLFRSKILGLIAPIGVVMLGILMTVAVMGTLHYQVNLMFLMLPTLICAIGIAQSVHLLINWQHEYSQCGSPREAARRAMEKIGTPALLCALTTAAGLVGMTSSKLKAMHEFGIYASIGVILTFVVALLLMTSLAARAKANPKKPASTPHPKWLERAVFGCLELALKAPRRVLAFWIAATALAVLSAAQMKVDFNFLKEFNAKVQWRVDTEKIEKIMGGVLSVVYVFDTGKADGIQDPALIRGIESLQNFAEKQPVVADTTSIVDYLKELNQAFHGGDAAYRVIPKERDALAQLMLVYELSGGKEMNDIRNIDRSKTVLELRVKVVGASGIRDLVEKLDAHLAANPIPGAKVELSGIGLLWIKIVDYIAQSQINGATGSFLMILIFIAVAFGSLRLGLWAMIPNVLPFIFVFGFMGAAGWHLDYFKMMLASVTMGISVDDTIHFLARLRVVFSEKGNYKEALRETMHEVGIPMTIASFALVAAFSSYLLSDLDVLTSFGVLLCGSVIVAWIIELLLTPTLMVLFKPFGPEFNVVAHRGALDTSAAVL